MTLRPLPRGFSLTLRRSLLAAAVLWSGAASSDEWVVKPRRVHHLPSRPVPVRVVEEVISAPILLVPNCAERWPPRVLNCRPQVYPPFTNDVLVAMEAPPRVRKLPYPTLFPYRYGN